MRPHPHKVRELRCLVLSSAFSQAEADRTLAWLDGPEATAYNVRRALYRGLCRRQAKQDGRHIPTTQDKIDSLSRRIAYRLDKLGYEYDD